MLALLFAGCGSPPRADSSERLVFDDPGPSPSAGDRLIVGANRAPPANPADSTLIDALLACGQRGIATEGLDTDHGWRVMVPKPADIDALARCVSRKAREGLVFRVRVETAPMAGEHRSGS